MKYKKGQSVTIIQEVSDNLMLFLDSGEYIIKECSEDDIEISYYIENKLGEGSYIEEDQLDLFDVQ